MSNLRQEARTRYPTWSRAQQARWVLAKLRAARITPHWAKMVPLTVAEIPRPDSQFCPRTLRASL